MPNQLPIIELDGTQYYVDERLSQIRNVTNPHDHEDVSPELIQFWRSQGWYRPNSQ